MKLRLLAQRGKTVKSGSFLDYTVDPDISLDAEALMLIAIEEWDRREADRKSFSKSKQASPSTSSSGTALATISSEKPGQKVEGGNRHGGWRGRGCGPRRPVGECWNCGGKNHCQEVCPSPKKDDNPSTSQTSKPQFFNSTRSKANGSVNTASDVAGAWSVVTDILDAYEDLDETDDLSDLSDSDVPSLTHSQR